MPDDEPAPPVRADVPVPPDATLEQVERWLCAAGSPTSSLTGITAARDGAGEVPGSRRSTTCCPRAVPRRSPPDSRAAVAAGRRHRVRRARDPPRRPAQRRQGGKRAILSPVAGDETGERRAVLVPPDPLVPLAPSRRDSAGWCTAASSAATISHCASCTRSSRRWTRARAARPAAHRAGVREAHRDAGLDHAPHRARGGRRGGAAGAGRRAGSRPAAAGSRCRSAIDALRGVHKPWSRRGRARFGTARSLEAPQHRLRRVFLVQLGCCCRKAQVAREPGISFDGPGELAARLIAKLPFPADRAQARDRRDCERPARGAPRCTACCRATSAAARRWSVAAALRAIECGWQAAIMAPTELLAEQHWSTVRRVADGLGVNLWYLTGEATTADRRAIPPRLAAGEPGLVVGTHALIQEDRAFREARARGDRRAAPLRRDAARTVEARRRAGHARRVPLMTATPIPHARAERLRRSDLGLSYIDELPPGRKPVSTQVYGMARRKRAYGWCARRSRRVGRRTSSTR